MLTLDAVRRTLRRFGVVIRKTDGEYRVNIKGGPEATAYYTTDIEDALETGVAMGQAETANSLSHVEEREEAVRRAAKCAHCGSTIGRHHTARCELAGVGAIRDLPSVGDTAWWNGQR